MDWAWNHMPVLRRIREQMIQEKPLKGERVATLHLEAKQPASAELLQDAGAEVAITGKNPLSRSG